MSNSVITALIGFGRTLEDQSVEAKTKMQVLHTLSEVSLTLTELSESGVGRSVNKLKRQPGQLGTTARLLLAKWKRLLHEHLSKESVKIASSSTSERRHPELISRNEKYCSDKNNLSPIREMQSTTSSHSKSEDNLPLQKSITQIRKSHMEQAALMAVRGKRKTDNMTDSLDSSSGLSFMESLNVACPRKKKNKVDHSKSAKQNEHVPRAQKSPPGFRNQVLSALSEDIDRPDILYKSTEPIAPPVPQPDPDDGDLKFKSKLIMWAPKPPRCNNINPDHDCVSDPLKLMDICLDVIKQNLHRLDHVGNVPYELIAPVLSHASAEDLARIERCNPQYTGYTDDLWLRHIQRRFTNLPAANSSPRAGEAWLEFYERLSREEANRLNRIINQSARRIREEHESRRKAVSIEAIAPRHVQRRIAREPTRVATQTAGAPSFRPYNVSHPNTPNAKTTNQPTKAGSSHSTNSNGGLLNKLRKQFHSRRLR